MIFPLFPWPSSSPLQLNSCFPYMPRFHVDIHLIRWTNHLIFLLSSILVTSSWYSIPLIWLLLILSPSVFQVHFLQYLISAPVTLPSCFVNTVLLCEPQSSVGRRKVL
jgi:hypothetical protein